MTFARKAAIALVATGLGILPAAAMPNKKQRAAARKAAKAAAAPAPEAARKAALAKALLGAPAPHGKAKRDLLQVRRLFQDEGGHPFFRPNPADRVGDCQIFAVDGPEAAGMDPRSLTVRSDGAVAWLGGPAQEIHRLSPMGYNHIPVPSSLPAPRHLAADGQGNLWFAGGEYLMRVQEDPVRREPGTGLPLFHLFPGEMPGIAGFLVGAGGGGPLVQRYTGFVRVGPDLQPDSLVLLEETKEPHTAIWDDTRKALYTVGPDRNALCRGFLLGPASLPPVTWPGEPGLHRIAADRDGRIWATVPDRDALAVLDPGSGAWRTVDLREQLGSNPPGPLAPKGIDLGPDGCLWVALSRASALLRVNPGTPLGCKVFPLAPGLEPSEVLRGRDGRMLFALPGVGIGAMVTQAPAAPAPEAPPEPAPAACPQPAPPGPSRAQRREWAAKAMFRACERQMQAAAAEDFYDDLLAQSGGTVPAAPEKKTEETKEAPAAPAMTADQAQDALLERDLFFTPTAVSHVESRHGLGRDATRSQFQAAYSSAEGIQALLAEGIGAVEEIGRIRRLDRRGRFYTLCSMPRDIGWHNHYGTLQPTHKFLVAMTRSQDPETGTFQYEVITAYPVARTFF